MKKKGFTLVELLAVIVILAVILLIAVPKIGDVIYSSRKNTFKNSAYALVSTAEKLYQESYAGSLNEESVLYDIENGKVLHDGVEVDIVDGKIDGKGFIQIDFEGDSKIALENDEFCAVKQFNEAEVTVSDKEEGTQCGKIYISFSYDLNGGTTTQNFENSYLEQTKVTLLEPTKENSTFAGWKVIKGNSIIKDNILTIGGKDTIIYALWTKYSTLTLNLDGGTISQDFQSTYKSGTTLTLTNPTKEGYTFAGWKVVSGNSIISESNLTMGSEDTILKANWTINTYQINYNLDGGTPGISTPTSGTYGSTATVSNPSKIGYTFAGWDVLGTGASIDDTNLTIGTSDITLSAKWTINTYTITYNLDSGTFENDMPAEAVYGSTIALELPVREGYVFVGWTVSGNNAILSENNLTIGDGDVTLTVMWVKEITEFAYTGGEQTFIVPTTGYYKIELWGASGGKYSSYIPGYGGYSIGVVQMSTNEKIYINVGGAGTRAAASSTFTTGGYNGGGSANYSAGTGGGATHIAKEQGLLSSLESSANNILIVAGGGGGTGVLNSNEVGGAGGGIKGNRGGNNSSSWPGGGYGGTQTSGGSLGSGSTAGTVGTFGSGGKGGYESSYSHGSGGGGGGLYGGAGGSARNGGGGGGSGYIGNSLLTNKYMYCYNCTTSDVESTKTYTTTCANETPTENCAKIGNGYAKITFISK